MYWEGDKEIGNQEKQPKTWGVYVARVFIILLLSGILFMASTPFISKYNQYNYTMRQCTVIEAKAREGRTVTYSTQLSIYTSDCGTLVYQVGRPGDELREMADYINEFQGEQLGFGFGNIQLQSNLSTVFKIEGFE